VLALDVRSWPPSIGHAPSLVPTVVSDLANGGQVLLDAETFERVKGDRALSAVDQHGYNDALVASRAARGPLAALHCCRRVLIMFGEGRAAGWAQHGWSLGAASTSAAEAQLASNQPTAALMRQGFWSIAGLTCWLGLAPPLTAL
jgi:hypothetical protein